MTLQDRVWILTYDPETGDVRSASATVESIEEDSAIVQLADKSLKMRRQDHIYRTRTQAAIAAAKMVSRMRTSGKQARFRSGE